MTQVDFAIRVQSLSEAEMLIAPVLSRSDGQLLVLVRSEEDEDGADLRLRIPVPIEKFLADHKARIVSFFPNPVSKNLRTVVFQSESQDVTLEISISDKPQPWMVAAAEELTRKLGSPMPPEQVKDLWAAVLNAERERAAQMGEPFSPPIEDNEEDQSVQDFINSLIGSDDDGDGVPARGPRVQRARVGGYQKELSLNDFMAFIRANGHRM